MPTVALPLVGSPVPDRSKVTTQTRRDNLVLQFGGWGMRLTTSPPQNKASLLRSLIMDARWIILVKDQGKDIRIKISILLLGMYSDYIEEEC
jgi:hypothetical protein